MRMEHWWFKVPLRLKSILFRGRLDRELDEELQFHLEQKIEEGVASGLSEEEARYAARRAMGGLEQHKEEMRDVRGVHGLTDFFDDVRFAIRNVRRTAQISALVVITLALGIGMAAAAFSMLDALILRPYPVPHPGNVVSLVSTSRDNSFEDFSFPEYRDIRAHTTSYDGVIAHSGLSAAGFSAKPGMTPRVEGAMLVSGNFFRVLDVEPRLGRGFRDDEDQVPGRDAVVVLGRDFWKREFASDPTVIDKTVRLNGVDFTVIGVAPESFPGLQIFARPDVYVPLAMARVFSTDRRKNFFEDRDDRELTVKARLKPGVTLQQARNELAAVAGGFEHDYPDLNHNRGAGVHTLFQMRTQANGSTWKFAVIFNLLGLGVLLVACTNVAGLLLSRARSRTREIAVRLALGAGRFRVVRLLLTESLLLASLGGVGGIVVGYGIVEVFQRFRIPTELPVTIPFRMDGRVLLACLMLSVLSAVLCGLAPALQSTRTDLVTGLKTADVDLPGRGRLWGRNALVVAQVSTSLMLIMASFLMARSFRQSVLQTTGFSQDHLLLARFDPRLVQYDPNQTQQFYKILSQRLRATPGVVSTGLTQNPPMGLDSFERLAFVPDGFDMPRDRENFMSDMDTVDEGFFQTMGIAILQGRGFRASDDENSPRVAVVNEHLAKHYWPGGDVVGKHIRLERKNGTPVEIVGVARTIKYADSEARPVEFVYMPLAQRPVARMAMMLRSSGDPLQLAGAVRNAVRALDPNLPISEMRSYEEVLRYSMVDGPRLAIEMVSAMGIVALLLAIAGLYGLVAYNVSRRTREIGIRMAIGAAPSDVLRMVIAKGLVLVGIGTAVGLVMGVAIEQLMNSMLFDAGGVDILVYLLVVPSMFLVTMLAAYVPARRASRIEPTQALRYE